MEGESKMLVKARIEYGCMFNPALTVLVRLLNLMQRLNVVGR